MSALVRGDRLAPATRAVVLSAYGYRWTYENEQRARQWYDHGGMNPPTMPLEHDAEWLRAHAFHVNRDGTLHKQRHHAEPAFMADESRA